VLKSNNLNLLLLLSVTRKMLELNISNSYSRCWRGSTNSWWPSFI